MFCSHLTHCIYLCQKVCYIPLAVLKNVRWRQISLAVTIKHFFCIMGCGSLWKNNKESLEQGILNKSHMENAFCFLPQRCWWIINARLNWRNVVYSHRQDPAEEKTHTKADVTLRRLIYKRIPLSSPILPWTIGGKIIKSSLDLWVEQCAHSLVQLWAVEADRWTGQVIK